MLDDVIRRAGCEGHLPLPEVDPLLPLPDDAFERALADQRREWLAGERIPLAELLRRILALNASPAHVAELIYHEFLLREECGESPNWEEYLEQFPQYADGLRVLRQADRVVEDALHSDGACARDVEFADYELVEELGRGGNGVVFKARQKTLDRVVALKMIRSGEFSSDTERKRFASEALASASLRHPNIVQIYQVGDVDGEPFLSLEFVEGMSLARRIDGTPLPAKEAATVVEKLARAMDYAHEKGVIHRDLKPSNVLLAKDSLDPKVTDFGAAKRMNAGAETRSVGAVGTPSYMAPEQVDSKIGQIDRRTDVYGLGAVLYESLSGRPPFRGESPIETLKHVIEAQPARPRLLNSAIPRDLETICLKCLEKDQRRRYESAQSLAADLRRFLEGQPVHARPVSALSRGLRWCRRHPAIASLAGALLFALCGGFAGIAYQWQRAESARRIAEASDAEAQELLGDLIDASPVTSVRGYVFSMSAYGLSAPRIEPLLKAETHCRSLLVKNPRNDRLRVALTNVYGRLGGLYLQRRQFPEANAVFQDASRLWESADADDRDQYRDWLARTYSWQALTAESQWNCVTALNATLKADALWQELAEEQPHDLKFVEELRHIQTQITAVLGSDAAYDECAPLLEEEQKRLRRLVEDSPADRVLKRRFAALNLLLAKISHLEGDAAKRTARWREAYDQYKVLADSRRDDLLIDLALAHCCCELICGASDDRYYSEAVSVLERLGGRLSVVSRHEPNRSWLRTMSLEGYCLLAACHTKAGQPGPADETYRNDIKPLVAAITEQQVAPDEGVSYLYTLHKVATLLRRGKKPDAALPILRKAAELASQYSAGAFHDVGLRMQLAWAGLSLSTTLNQFGESATALEQAEMARRLIDDCRRSETEGNERFAGALSVAWEKIGKARWDLGRHDEAMAAFRESLAAARLAFEKTPSVLSNRVQVSRCHDRLIHWCGLLGDRKGIADSLLEIEKLWPSSSKKLAAAVLDFENLAKKVEQDRTDLSSEELAERDRYLGEAKRLRQAAEAAAHRMGRMQGRIAGMSR